MTHNTKDVVKNNTINLILTLNYYVGSHKNRGQEQLGYRNTKAESSSFSVLI